jgi:hypothetical protein
MDGACQSSYALRMGALNPEREPPGSGAHMNFLAPEMIVNLVPRANVDIDELVASGHRSMALYNKMIGRVERWLDKFADDEKVTIADLFKAYALLAPTLDSLVTLQAKISEQRAAEARDVTAQMQTNLEASGKREAPKIEASRAPTPRVSRCLSSNMPSS